MKNGLAVTFVVRSMQEKEGPEGDCKKTLLLVTLLAQYPIPVKCEYQNVTS